MLKDKVVLITGAARGIGAGIARCFIDTGASVVITDLDAELVNTAAGELGADVMGLVADAASQEAMGEATAKVIDRFSRLDILVNNAGIGGPKIKFEEISSSDSAFMGMSDEVWDQQLMFNLRTTFSSSHAAIPHLPEGGSIINIASIAALGPTATLPAYGAAKAGVVHLGPVQGQPIREGHCVLLGRVPRADPQDLGAEGSRVQELTSASTSGTRSV